MEHLIWVHSGFEEITSGFDHRLPVKEQPTDGDVAVPYSVHQLIDLIEYILISDLALN